MGEGYGREAELPAVVERLVAKQAAAAAALERRPWCWSLVTSPATQAQLLGHNTASCIATTASCQAALSWVFFTMSLKLKEKQVDVFFWNSYLQHKCSCRPTTASAAYNLTTCCYVFFLFYSAHLLRRTQKWRKIGKYIFQKPNILTKASVKPLHQPHTRLQTTLVNNFFCL